jgi:hypothetical protein
VDPAEKVTGKQRLGKHVPAAKNIHNNRRTVGLGVFYVVHVVSNTQYAVKEKWKMSYSQDFILWLAA